MDDPGEKNNKKAYGIHLKAKATEKAKESNGKFDQVLLWSM